MTHMRTANELKHAGYRIVQLLLLLTVCALLFLGIAHYSFNGFHSRHAEGQPHDYRSPRPAHALISSPDPIPDPAPFQSLSLELAAPSVAAFADAESLGPSLFTSPKIAVPDSSPRQAAVYQFRSAPPGSRHAGQTAIAVVNVKQILRLMFADYKARPTTEEYKIVTSRLQAATATVASAEGLWLVLDNSNSSPISSPYIYSETGTFDITGLVIKELGLSIDIVTK